MRWMGLTSGFAALASGLPGGGWLATGAGGGAGAPWLGRVARPAPAPHMMQTLRDDPREGPVRAEIRVRIAALAKRGVAR